jgi:GFO/IDH/MocA oxidoreductase family protein
VSMGKLAHTKPARGWPSLLIPSPLVGGQACSYQARVPKGSQAHSRDSSVKPQFPQFLPEVARVSEPSAPRVNPRCVLHTPAPGRQSSAARTEHLDHPPDAAVANQSAREHRALHVQPLAEVDRGFAAGLGRLARTVAGWASVVTKAVSSSCLRPSAGCSLPLDGGGALMNQGVHYVDLLCWILGHVEEVAALWATQARTIEMEDVALALLTFRSGNFLSVLDGDGAPLVTGEQAGANVAVIRAVYDSARTGRPVVPAQPQR